MSDDILSGMWKQIKGNVKAAFGRLTDDDLTEIEGNSERAVGKLQERYGYSKLDAQRAWQDFQDGLNRTDAERHMDRAADKAEDAVDEAKKGLRRALD